MAHAPVVLVACRDRDRQCQPDAARAPATSRRSMPRAPGGDAPTLRRAPRHASTLRRGEASLPRGAPKPCHGPSYGPRIFRRRGQRQHQSLRAHRRVANRGATSRCRASLRLVTLDYPDEAQTDTAHTWRVRVLRGNESRCRKCGTTGRQGSRFRPHDVWGWYSTTALIRGRLRCCRVK